jgi:hypothetical protein
LANVKLEWICHNDYGLNEGKRFQKDRIFTVSKSGLGKVASHSNMLTVLQASPNGIHKYLVSIFFEQKIKQKILYFAQN